MIVNGLEWSRTKITNSIGDDILEIHMVIAKKLSISKLEKDISCGGNQGPQKKMVVANNEMDIPN